MELHERRDMYNGFGDGLARAFELAVTPVVFGGIGFGLDAEMRRVEADKPWTRGRGVEGRR